MTFTSVTWAYQEVISSSKLNLMAASIDDLDARVGGGAGTSQSSQSNTTQTGAPSADMTYNAATVTVPAGTWMLTAQLTLRTTTAVDSVCCGIYNFTTSTEVANSRGAAGVPVSNTTQIGCHSRQNVIVTVAAPTVFRPLACRNGGTTLQAESVAGSPAGAITAVRLK